jgi:Amt family ammonium transporter
VVGARGTLAAALFDFSVGWGQVGVQMIGIGAAFVWTFGASYLVFSILESTVGLRVGEESEHIGLDEHEHEIGAYPEFEFTDELRPEEV